MRLMELACENVLTITPGDSIDRAMRLMEDNHLRHLPVVDGESPVGIVSDRDLLSAVGWLPSHERIANAERAGLVGPTRVAQIMSSPLHSLPPEAAIADAGRLMLEKKISAVPLISKQRLVGIVTETDFLRCYLDDRLIAPGTGWRFHKVSDYMGDPVLTLPPEDTLASAIKLMRENRIRHVPIVEGRHVVGIVSDRDMRLVIGRSTVEHATESGSARPGHLGVVLREVMNRSVETVSPSTTLAEAADRMLRARIGALPVTQDMELLGIVTESDLLRALVEACAS
jgi:CBS domain-containing protein